MLARVVTALVGIPLLLLVVWFGFPWLMLALLAVSLLALGELYRLVARGGVSPSIAAGSPLMVATVLAFQFRQSWGEYLSLMVAGGCILSLVWVMVVRRNGFTSWACTVGGVLYVGFLLSHALLLREVGEGTSEGRNWLLFAFLTTFANDTGAFFTGRAIGRHAMAPTISPRKTWEGAIGGLVFAVGIAVALGALFRLPAGAWQYALLGLAIGVAAQLGDLAESKIKRTAQVKEAGGLLPGHGGLLDRLDSVLFVLPVVYYLVVFVLGR